MEQSTPPPPGEYEPVDIVQARGPRLKFSGKLIASTEFETRGRDPMRVGLEIWETKGGALIACRETAPAEREGFANAEALVVEPGEEQAMRFAVMAFFDWHDRARSMVRKQLKWSLTREVA